MFVTAELHSDVNVTEGGITIYNADGSHIVTYTKPINANVTSFEIESVDFMSPKTEYLIEIFVRTALNEAVTDRIPFTTEGLVPDEGDNTPPDGRTPTKPRLDLTKNKGSQRNKRNDICFQE